MTPQTIQRVAAFFLFSLMLLIIGVVSAFENWAPARLFSAAREIAVSWQETGAILPRDAYVRRRAGAADDRYVVHQPAQAAPGYVLINRLQLPENQFVTELIDETGEVINSWQSDYSQIVEGGKPGALLHPTYPLPDGSLLQAYDQGAALVRVDACGKVLWSRTDQTYHHSIRPDEDAGGFWVWQAGIWYGGDDQRLVRFAEKDGEIVESIDLIDDIILGSKANQAALGFPDGFGFRRDLPQDASPDLYHPNDIKPLPARLASAFPQFKTGDLLISLRNINLLAVVDRSTKEVLWAQNGPWQDQHDPDWREDGTITVYSNNQRRGLSTVIRIDPKTNIADDVFAGTEFRFYSRIMGQHDLLPNGNWLIASPLEGAALEVTPSGQTVRELSNRFTGEFNGILSYSQFVPRDYYVTSPRCGG